MTYTTVLGECLVCHCLFTFNADRVPSIRVNGVKEPVCLACMTAENVRRQTTGRPLLVILPGAYDPDEV